MKIKFNGFNHADSYVGRGGAWAAGDVKDISDDDAKVLLADFAAHGRGSRYATVDRDGKVLTPADPKPAFVKG